MATQSALSAKIDEVAATLAAEIEEIKAALESKVPPEIDLSDEVAKLDALNAAIAGIIPDAPEGVDVSEPVVSPVPDTDIPE